MTFLPRLDVLPEAQRAVWPRLRDVPPSFVLYGGTAIALRFAHRASADFDFFGPEALDHRTLASRLPMLRSATTLQESVDTLTVLVDGVKLSWFGGIKFGRVGEPDPTADGVLRAASIEDLAGTKIKALLQRVEAKDYRDVAALLDHGVPLATILGAAQTLFGPAFNPLIAQKALCFFQGGDLDTLEPALRQRLVDVATRDVTVEPLALRSPRLD